MDNAYKEDEHTYDYIDSSAFSNYAYDGLTNIQKSREVLGPTAPNRSSVSKSRQKRCLFLSIITGVIVIIIIAVVVVVVVKKNNESKLQKSMEFEATMTLVAPWQPEYSDPESEEYQRFTSDLLTQIEDGLRQSEIGVNLDFIIILNLRPGSVICDIKIFMKTVKFSVNGESRNITPFVIASTITDIVKEAKQNNPASLLAKVDPSEIRVRQPQTGALSATQSTSNPPQTSTAAIRSSTTTTTTWSTTTSIFRRTSSIVSSTPSTSPITTTTLVTEDYSPCTNITYLETVLFILCYDDTAYYRALLSNDSTRALCRFLNKTLRCIVQEVATDTGITCSRDEQNKFLEENADDIQKQLSIDPRICLSSNPYPSFETSPSTVFPEPDMTTSAIITDNGSPCTNSSYLEQLLLKTCVDYSRYIEASQSDNTLKCRFMNDVIACVINNVFNETGVRCTKDQKDAIIKENADLVSRLLSLDITTCK
ncbi:uncharacterized protein LOC133197586 [Saccostrea echinata]|uniref:uncharacterized protein LOC133197586 n=1 Tax=Saccostrea echinata TaxID=191078 RepID=UPI002A832C57|nr:uncharacterized protein LOC133197586 [Saccostrea echinata]